MNIEFHYYVLYYLANSAGLDDKTASRIAGSSQLVDEFLEPLNIRSNDRILTIPATQNYQFWNNEIQKDVYLPFHFLPGIPEEGSRAREDRRRDPWIVTPDSPGARTILVEALRSNDPFRIGIALHTYADTWAHQNFTARSDSTNRIDPASVLPPAGHMQAFSSPDDPGMIWEDPRLAPAEKKVVNALRFHGAAKKIYRFLKTWLHKDFSDEDYILDPLLEIWKSRQPGQDKHASRDSRISDYIISLGVPPRNSGEWFTESGLPASLAGSDSSELFASQSSKAARVAHSFIDRLKPRIQSPGSLSGLSGNRQDSLHSYTVESHRFMGSSLWQWSEAARTQRELVRNLFTTADFS